MLKLTIVGEEYYDEESQTFFTENDVHLTMEHSLLSVSKWEQKHTKPFLEDNKKTSEETLDYVECMILDENYPAGIIQRFNSENFETINAYIDSPATATTFLDMAPKSRRRPEVITSELIYYWMIAHNIPLECEAWHLNRLFALIRICNIKNDPKGGKKMAARDVAARNRELNAQRRAQLGTTG